MQFQIVHIVPDPRYHGLYGYREVIESLRWGLTELGHDVAVTTNICSPDRINIVLGGQMLSAADLQRLPASTIFYNFEQMAGYDLSRFKSVMGPTAQNFRIWDYCPRNLEIWNQWQPKYPPLVVPVGWSPTLRRIARREETVDVLFYGLPTPVRMSVFDRLCSAALKCLFACGLYGEARDDLIARSKIVLNVNMYEESRIFEVVRVSYLLANGKAVVSDLHPQSFIEPDMREALVFAAVDQIADVCVGLVQDDAARRALEERGRAIFEKRDIREILRTALASL